MSIEKINSSSMYNENLYFYNDENPVIMDAILDSQRVVEDGKQRTKRENFDKIIAYNKLISLVSKLVTELSLPNNSLSMSLVISRLIYSGYFSNRMNFKFGDEDDELYGALGMSIVKGKGVCRHIASFSKDIFDELDLYNYLLPCVCEARLTEEEGFLIKPNHVVNLIEYDGNFSLRLGNISELYSKLGVNVVLGYGCCRHVCYFHKDVMDKVFDNGECLFVSVTDFKNRISGMKKPATHSINLITHKDVLYGFDTLNGGLYNFESEFHLEKLSKNKTHFYYKPYLHMIFENYSMTDVKNSLVRYRIASYLKKIDISEYDEISLYTKDKICNGKNLITDFVIDTNEDKNKIKKLMLV